MSLQKINLVRLKSSHIAELGRWAGLRTTGAINSMPLLY